MRQNATQQAAKIEDDKSMQKKKKPCFQKTKDRKRKTRKIKMLGRERLIKDRTASGDKLTVIVKTKQRRNSFL